MLFSRASLVLRFILFAGCDFAGRSSLLLAGVETIPTEGRTVYRLALARTATQRLIIGSTYDNRLCAWDEDGKHRWDAPLGGLQVFPSDQSSALRDD